MKKKKRKKYLNAVSWKVITPKNIGTVFNEDGTVWGTFEIKNTTAPKLIKRAR